MNALVTPKSDTKREAIEALRGYVYQIYQTAIAWTELSEHELLFLEVAEDYAIVAQSAIDAVQVKATAANITINSESVITSIESFIQLTRQFSTHKICVRHLTTSTIGKEQNSSHRFGNTPTLELWRDLARSGDIAPLRSILSNSKLNDECKSFIGELSDQSFRDNFLKQIHFDCGAPSFQLIKKVLKSNIASMISEKGGMSSDIQSCLSEVTYKLLSVATEKERDKRCVTGSELAEIIEKHSTISVSKTRFDQLLQSQQLARLGTAIQQHDVSFLSTINTVLPNRLLAIRESLRNKFYSRTFTKEAFKPNIAFPTNPVLNYKLPFTNISRLAEMKLCRDFENSSIKDSTELSLCRNDAINKIFSLNSKYYDSRISNDSLLEKINVYDKSFMGDITTHFFDELDKIFKFTGVIKISCTAAPVAVIAILIQISKDMKIRNGTTIDIHYQYPYGPDQIKDVNSNDYYDFIIAVDSPLFFVGTKRAQKYRMLFPVHIDKNYAVMRKSTHNSEKTKIYYVPNSSGSEALANDSSLVNQSEISERSFSNLNHLVRELDYGELVYTWDPVAYSLANHQHFQKKEGSEYNSYRSLYFHEKHSTNLNLLNSFSNLFIAYWNYFSLSPSNIIFENVKNEDFLYYFGMAALNEDYRHIERQH